MHFRPLLLCPLLLCTVALVSCKRGGTPPAAPEAGAPMKQPSQPTPTSAAPEAVQPLATGMNALAVELYRAASPEGENFAFSPGSISAAFSMLYAGAKGETAQELQRVFHFQLPERELLAAHGALLGSGDGKCELESANSLWVAQGFTIEPGFEQLMSESARASLERADFRKEPEPSRARINQWVSEQTRGHIPDLIPQGAITSDSRLVLANALYFKGRWKERFDKDTTQPAAFRLLSGQEAQVPTMQRTGKYRMARLPSVSLLELAYECSDITMVILLPETGEPVAEEGAEPTPTKGPVLSPAQALERLEKELSAEALAQWVDGLGPEREVAVMLPRFKLKAKVTLTEVLRQLGLKRAFSDGAEFQGITQESVALSGAFHQSFVQVDEEGTEAAAATGAVISITSVGPPPSQFTVDRPFLFALRHKSGALLFLGRVTDPR